MRVADSSWEKKPIIGELKMIAAFLNAVGPKITLTQWKDYLAAFRKERGIIFPFFEFQGRKTVTVVTLEEAKTVRQAVYSDLRYLRDNQYDSHDPLPDRMLHRFPYVHREEPPFGPLTIRLNELAKTGSWHCVSLKTKKPEPGQAILSLKRRDAKKRSGDTKREAWTTERWAASFVPFPERRSLRDWIYSILGRSLLTGAIVRLKRCRHCLKYFVATKDIKREFCEGTTCHDDFFKSTGQGRPGYWKAWRHEKRERAMEVARKLRESGSSDEEIERKTKLPSRVLRKLLDEMATEEG